MPEFRYITAEEWGGVWVRPPVKEELEDPECYIHHTAGNPLKDRPAEDALQILNKIAQDGKGYSFLDYDYLVHWEEAKDLYTIAEGRGEWLSAATRNRNELGEAICLFGYFHPGSTHSAYPNPGHIEATALGIVKMIERRLLARDCMILGHYQNLAFPIPQTVCPGEYFIPHVPEVILRVRELLNPSGDDMQKTTPKRLLDTREQNSRIGAGTSFSIQVRSGASMAQITVTVVNPSGAGHMTVWESGVKPNTSFLNYTPGEVLAETLWVPLDAGGNCMFYTYAETHLVVDFTGLYQ